MLGSSTGSPIAGTSRSTTWSTSGTDAPGYAGFKIETRYAWRSGEWPVIRCSTRIPTALRGGRAAEARGQADPGTRLRTLERGRQPGLEVERSLGGVFNPELEYALASLASSARRLSSWAWSSSEAGDAGWRSSRSPGWAGDLLGDDARRERCGTLDFTLRRRKGSPPNPNGLYARAIVGLQF